MSTAKELIIDRVNNMSDDMDENQMLDRLYMLSRLEHSRKRCENEGTIKDSELVYIGVRDNQRFNFNS